MQIQTQEILKKLESAQSKKDINEAMLLIRAFSQEWQEHLTENEAKEIISLIREKSLECIFQKGDVPERDILWAYGVFKRLESLSGDLGDDRFKSYIDLCAGYVKDTSISNYERLLFIDCASVAMLLSGDCDGAFKFFLAHIIYLSLAEPYVIEAEQFIGAFCKYYNIPIEWILEIQRDALKSEYFANASDFMKKSVFLWSMHVIWNIPNYFNNRKWKENFKTWLEVLENLLKSGNLDLAMYVEFYIYHKMGNSAQVTEDWQEYNDKVVKLVEPYFVEYGKTLPKCKESVDRSAGRKIKIGILKDRIVGNSPYKVEYSLIKALLSNEEFASKYEIVVYSMAYVQKSDDDIEVMKSLVEIGAAVVSPAYSLVKQHSYYVPHLKKALLIRDAILAEGIDILISTGTIDGSDFLLATRSAPMQIFWSHGNGRYDIAGIDKRMSHCAVDSLHKFELFAVPMDIDRFYNPPRSPEVIAAERAKYPIKEDTVVLGVIGRLVKVDSDEYLECIAEIMRKHENTIFIAGGTGNIPVIREKVEKLGISKERFFMPGWVDAHIYGHIIDIFCNTFPLEQGESLSEFIHKGKSWIGLYDIYYKKFLDAKFSEELKTLKFNQDKYLVYIRNIENYQKDLKNWDTICSLGNIVLLYDSQIKQLVDKIDFPCETKCVEKPEILTDFTLEIKGDMICMVGGNTCLVAKKPFPFLRFYNDVEYYNEYYSTFMVEHQDMFWEEGQMLYRSIYGISAEDYMKRLSHQIERSDIRSKIGDVVKTQMIELYNAKSYILTRRIREIIDG